MPIAEKLIVDLGIRIMQQLGINSKFMFKKKLNINIYILSAIIFKHHDIALQQYTVRSEGV